MLQLHDLHVGYGAISVLRGVSFTVSKGAITALIGANGAGKSTTLNTISGLLQPSRGEILLRMDAHVVYPPNYISELVAALERTGADSVGGVLITVPGHDSVELPEEMAHAVQVKAV